MKKGNAYMGAVKVGPKGQIVIPKEVRDMFEIETGDSLIILADSRRGIAIERMSAFNQIADKILGKVPLNAQDEGEVEFAKAIKAVEKEYENE